MLKAYCQGVVFMFPRNLFSQRIKYLRSDKEITQSDLAKEVGLSKQAINDIEQGRRGTSIEKLIEIADFFDVSIDYLVGRTDNPKSHKN